MIRFLLSSMLFISFFSTTLSASQCDIVAIVFEENICKEDLYSESDLWRTVGPPNNFDQTGFEKTRLERIIREIAARKLLSPESFRVDEEEIEGFIRFTDGMVERQIRESEEIIIKAEHLLATRRYSEPDRRRLESLITSSKKVLDLLALQEEQKNLLESQTQRRTNKVQEKEFHDKLKTETRKFAVKIVSDWKMNKALFEHYGGRLAFQQAGLEPIDAYRRHLEEIYEKGKLNILKDEYTSVFKDFERYLAGNHFYAKEDDETYFDTPFWASSKLEDKHKARILELENIPHK